MKQDDPLGWKRSFEGTEHPETARLRLGKETVDQLAAIKRESVDNSYRYINDLIDKAKEELGHARSASNDHRKAALAQHIDEIVAYLNGQEIEVTAPRLAERGEEKSGAKSYVLDEVSGFFGRVRCLIDQWHAEHLSKVHKEIAIWHNLQDRSARQRAD